MAEINLKSRIIFRNDAAADWSTHNPILKVGEPGWDSVNKRLKIGDGTTVWNNLGYAVPNPQIYQDNKIIKNSESFSIESKGLSLKSSNNIFFHNTIFPSFNVIMGCSASDSNFYFYPSTSATGSYISNLGQSNSPWDKIYCLEYNFGSIMTAKYSEIEEAIEFFAN